MEELSTVGSWYTSRLRAIGTWSSASEKEDHQNDPDCNCASVCFFLDSSSSVISFPNISYGSATFNTSVVFVCLNSSVNPSCCPCLHVGKTKLLLSLFAEQSSFDRGSEASTLKSVHKWIDCRVQTGQHHSPSVQRRSVKRKRNVEYQDVENQIR